MAQQEEDVDAASIGAGETDLAAEQQDGERKSKGAKHKLSSKKIQKQQDVYDRRGIVYISRIPPHLKPQKLRYLLSQHGELGRVYLAPEDPFLRKKRKQEGKNTGKNFTEGWVEFEDKKVAKQVVEMLNGQPMGGKRRSAFYYDLWCIKYLPKFKWDNLTEEINYQKAVRDQKLGAEISAAKRERDFYLSRVDKAKGVAAMLERKRKKGEAEAPEEPAAPPLVAAGGAPSSSQQGQLAAKKPKQQAQQPEGVEAGAGAPLGSKVLRRYGQRKAKLDSVTDADAPVMSEGMLRLLAGKKKARQAE